MNRSERVLHRVIRNVDQWSVRSFGGIGFILLGIEPHGLQESDHNCTTIIYNKDCDDTNINRCAQTLIFDGDSLRRYAVVVHDSLCAADVCLDFKTAVSWTAGQV